MSPSDTAKLREETQPGQTLKSITKWGPKITWNTTPDTKEDTATNQAPPPARQIAIESNPYLGVGHFEATEPANLRAATTMEEGKRKFLSMEGHCGHPKEKAVPRGIETEYHDKMAQLHHPMHIFGPAYPSYPD